MLLQVQFRAAGEHHLLRIYSHCGAELYMLLFHSVNRFLNLDFIVTVKQYVMFLFYFLFLFLPIV